MTEDPFADAFFAAFRGAMVNSTHSTMALPGHVPSIDPGMQSPESDFDLLKLV